MISSLIEILLAGVEGEDAPLRTNGFARRLTFSIIRNKSLPDNRIRFLSDLFKSRVPVTLPDYKPVRNRDNRIKTLFLGNVRQYHSADEKASLFSLDFSDAGMPVSSVFQGANGSGKTTVFASLEYLYLRNSDIAHLHCEDEDILEYFRSVGGNIDDINLLGALSCGIIKLTESSDMEIPAAFCSECDYFEIMRNWNSKEVYFADQLGYGEFFKLIELLKELNFLYSKSREYLAKISETDKLKKEQAEVDKSSKEYRLLQDKISKVNREKISLNSIFMQTAINYGYTHISQFNRRIKDNPVATENFGELRALKEYLEDKWREILERLMTLSEPIIKSVVGESLDKNFESLTLSVHDDMMDISLEVIPGLSDKEPEDKSPVEYFNTFRLKLFCIALKMGLYCCAKTYHGINLPFVMDDVFDSSDFANRTKIRMFTREVIKAHNDVFKDREEESPLQFIFFTQDNLIAENVYRGISDVEDDSIEKSGKVRFARLFRPKDANPEDEKDIDYLTYTLDGQEVNTIKIYDSI